MTQETDQKPLLSTGDIAGESYPPSADVERALSTQKKEAEYNASDTLRVLRGVEAVRERPGMYIGDTGRNGLHHLFKEIVDNAMDEVMEGHCTQIQVTLGADYSLAVEDNGRGIPVHFDEHFGKTAVELVFTELHRGGKRSYGYYKARGGLHGVGASCVNALSVWLECEVRHEGNMYRQRFERGEPTGPLAVVGECGANEQGTKVTWLADTAIFRAALDTHGSLGYEPDRLRTRLREIAFLNPTVTVTFDDTLHEAPTETYHYPNGIADYVAHLNAGKSVLHPDIIAFRFPHDETTLVEVALQYQNGDDETLVSFVNGIYMIDRGTHVTGFKSALTRALNRYAHKHGLSNGTAHRTGGDLRKGLTAVISILMPNPQFESATRTVLTSLEMEGIVHRAAYKHLSAFFEANPENARAILTGNVTKNHVG